MVQVKQITPAELFLNRNWQDEYLKEEFSDFSFRKLQLLKFRELSESEIKSLEWDTDEIESIVHKTS